ncbi:MAG: hypothetical protein SVP26_02615 [Chloroflexota bacterium]|nr:hypothetical protein [Chloroflexota bacterium]
MERAEKPCLAYYIDVNEAVRAYSRLNVLESFLDVQKALVTASAYEAPLSRVSAQLGKLFVTFAEDVGVVLGLGVAPVGPERPTPEYYPSASGLLTSDLRVIVAKVIELAGDTVTEQGFPIEYIKVRPSRSAEDLEFEEIVVEFGIDASADDAFSLWDAVGEKIDEWKASLPRESIEFVNTSVGFQLKWK